MSEQTPLEPTVDLAPSGDDRATVSAPDNEPQLSSGDSVLQALRASLPSVPRILLREPESSGGSPIVRPSSEEMPSQQDPTARLQLLGEIARGGMGAVLKGRDIDLGRDVAVKVLLESHQGKTQMLQRFVEEAQISGQLQHPGIAPVYELGQFVDKRPYFTMKLVKGKTLATQLGARKTADEERTRFVGIFAQICQTLAYAHARGVIHRDLKPHNVMVGAFGEVQVMDWGLAKVLKDGGVADELKAKQRVEISLVQTARSIDALEAGSHTQAGTVLGTPAYMAPEQARGDVDLVDERADVFGLGAILCEILTGQPPFVGKMVEAHYQARTAKLDDAFARLETCEADAELIALTKCCLAAQMEERPRHAGEVAEQVTAYQQSVTERLRQAELAETEARARAEEESKTREQAEARLGAERRARRLTLGLAAAMLMALTMAGGGGLWYQRQRADRQAELTRRRADTERDVAAALRESSALATQADKLSDDPPRWEAALRMARSAALRAQGVLRTGASTDELSQQVETVLAHLEQAERDRRLVVELDEIRLGSETNFDKRAAVPRYATAFASWGMNVGKADPKVMGDRLGGHGQRERLLAALLDWSRLTADEPEREWLEALLTAAESDPDAFIRRWREALALQGAEALLRLADDADISQLPVASLVQLARDLRFRGEPEAALRLLDRLRKRHPGDLWLNHELSWALLAVKPARPRDAVRYRTVAAALRPTSAWPHSNLGILSYELHQLDEALAEFQKAIELDPGYLAYRINLGKTLKAKGRIDDAIEEYRKVIALEPNNALAHNNLGNALGDKGQLDEAIAEYKKAIEFDAKNVLAHNNLGITLSSKGRWDEAIAEFKKASELDPKFADAHNNLGVVLHGQGRWDEAVAEWRKAIEFNPQNAKARDNLAVWEPIVALQSKLPAFLEGKFQPRDNAERIALLRLCVFKKYTRSAAQLYADAFAAEPKQADDLKAQTRYDAACCSALACAGQGEDAAKLGSKELARWRKQALDWLRADLNAYGKLLDGGKTEDRTLVRQRLQHWQRDADLSGIRDAKELAQLPADERHACEKLWADVTALLQKAQSRK